MEAEGLRPPFSPVFRSTSVPSEPSTFPRPLHKILSDSSNLQARVLFLLPLNLERPNRIECAAWTIKLAFSWGISGIKRALPLGEIQQGAKTKGQGPRAKGRAYRTCAVAPSSDRELGINIRIYLNPRSEPSRLPQWDTRTEGHPPPNHTLLAAVERCLSQSTQINLIITL